MTLEQLNKNFEEEQYWLQKQPEMQPWETGCTLLTEKLERHIDTLLEGKKVAYRSDFLPRIWTCIVYHWKKAVHVDENETSKTFSQEAEAVSLEEVLKSLANRIAFDPPGKKLGGDPIPDVAYTVFYVKKDNDASVKMDTEYKKYCIGVVKNRFDMRNSFEEWWSPFMCELGGFEYESNEEYAKLYEYSGENHLKSWLSTACYNHARGYLRRMKRYVYPEMDFLEILALDEETPEELAMIMESGYKDDNGYVLNVLERALNELDVFGQTVLKQKYFDGLTLIEIGYIHYPELKELKELKESEKLEKLEAKCRSIIGGRIRTIRHRLEANMLSIIKQEKDSQE